MPTLPDLKADYLENRDYDLVKSQARAREFIKACRGLLLMLPRSAQTGGTGGEMAEFDSRMIQDEQRRAERWLAGRGGSVKYFDLGDYRS